MASTPQDVITSARYIINDINDGVNDPRQSDAELLGYFNDAIKEISSKTMRPDLFTAIGDLLCEQGTCEQTVTFLDAQAVIEVLCLHNGAAILPFDIPTMNAFNPNWRADAEGAATQWSMYDGNPLKFFVYPKAPAAQTIDVRYVRNPTVLTLLDPITEVPAAMFPAIVDYIVYRSESKDDEHANSNRAVSHQQAFVAKVKGA